MLDLNVLQVRLVLALTVIFLGAVLRVAGATTFACRFGCAPLFHQHPRNYRGIFLAYESQLSRSIHQLWGLIPILTSLVCSPSAKLVISSSCPNHVLDAAQSLARSSTGAGAEFLAHFLFLQEFHPVVKSLV